MSSTSDVQQATPQPLDASKLIYTLADSPRDVPDPATSCAGDTTICTDHMILATWSATTGWSAPKLKPYGPLSIMPAASCLHYATECFEGLKAYRGSDGKLRVFRMEHNAARLQMSCNRISLPTVDTDQLIQLVHALLAVDGPKWLPEDQAGEFLYIRPTVIGTQSNLGVQAPRSAMFYIIMGYVARVDAVPGGMKLLTSPDNMVRSWVGGFGHAKVGANYGPSVIASQEASREGFHQILWLYGEDGECTEAGGSNFFVVWERKGDKQKELVTAPLDDRLILDGVTRRSCLELVRERLGGELEITERKFTINEVIEAAAEGRLLESFSVGTMWFVTPVSHIRHRGYDIKIPMGEQGEMGEVTGKLKGWLGDIMYGGVEHSWATVVSEKRA
ncbi:branched-chain amino acid aminotransferase II [Aspergillus sclerotiicarbonarius CBS 121057]|uniref:Branched-chain-amino-acid aminotransferase n=1 Tax=Aspergillus sclerotiicarbonarius (strain CBS 121057 / IBT 28362) TaxID=1448318 RepID=A0A319F072_ASPSB|nr:branched-chain amino acid aminotransferase II [Aspergillus sclerotiicarbonarius CBS 121057]